MGQPEFNKGRAPVELGQQPNQNRRGPAGHSVDFVVSEVIAMPAQMSQVDATQNDGRLVQLYASPNSNSLAWLESAFDVLARSESLEEIKTVRDKAAAVRQYAHNAKASLALQNRAAELKLRGTACRSVAPGHGPPWRRSQIFPEPIAPHARRAWYQPQSVQTLAEGSHCARAGLLRVCGLGRKGRIRTHDGVAATTGRHSCLRPDRRKTSQLWTIWRFWRWTWCVATTAM